MRCVFPRRPGAEKEEFLELENWGEINEQRKEE